jgi:predicted metal-binding membrane protein
VSARAARSGAAASLPRVERTLLAGGIATVTLLCWSYLWGRTTPAMHAADHGYVMALVMWAVMMCGMMLPGAAPMLLTYERVSSSVPRGHLRRTLFFAAAYLALWLGFSILGAAGQVGLRETGMLSHLGASTRPLLSAMLLLTAGAYQLSPLKRACLHRCRTPMGFVLTEWRPGVRGALQMGLRHGTECVLCCWALMALAFVLGTMNLLWMAVLTILMLAEKTLPGGRQIGLLAGYAFLLWGALVLVRGV